MILDFSKICNTYDIDSYTKKCFENTSCPNCPAVGRFNLHGSYRRHIVFFLDDKLHYEHMEIKRVRCLSCRSTHAVMPGDLIPYKLLSFFVFMFVLNECLVIKTPVLKVAERIKHSYQFIYSCLRTFFIYKNNIHQYFKETSPTEIPPGTGNTDVIELIKEPYLEFQSGFTKHNRRPCFMRKFFNRGHRPNIGIYKPLSIAT